MQSKYKWYSNNEVSPLPKQVTSLYKNLNLKNIEYANLILYKI